MITLKTISGLMCLLVVMCVILTAYIVIQLVIINVQSGVLGDFDVYITYLHTSVVLNIMYLIYTIPSNPVPLDKLARYKYAWCGLSVAHLCCDICVAFVISMSPFTIMLSWQALASGNATLHSLIAVLTDYNGMVSLETNLFSTENPSTPRDAVSVDIESATISRDLILKLSKGGVCPICTEDLLECDLQHDNHVVQLSCGHIYCYRCIYIYWEKYTTKRVCVSCRAEHDPSKLNCNVLSLPTAI